MSMSTNITTPPTTKVLLGCSACGAGLPDEAQFSLKCGKPVNLSAEKPRAVEEETTSSRDPAAAAQEAAMGSCGLCW